MKVVFHTPIANKEAKNLVAAQEIIGNVVAGDIDETKSLLVQYSFYLQKRGNREDTIDSRVGILKILHNRGANLNDPESIKQAIASQKWVDKRKCNAVDAYTTTKNAGKGVVATKVQGDEETPIHTQRSRT